MEIVSPRNNQKWGDLPSLNECYGTLAAIQQATQAVQSLSGCQVYLIQ